MSQPLPLDPQIEAATRMALKTRQFYDLFLRTTSEEGHLLHRPVLSEYNEVIRFIRAACRDAALLELHSLFADRRDTVNLPRLVREVEQALQGRLAHARLLSAGIPENITKVKILRDNAIAHRTKQIEFDDVFREANITRSEVSDTIDVAVKIVNELRLARDLEPAWASPLPLETFDRMLTALRSGA
jgi:hypothetical protein